MSRCVALILAGLAALALATGTFGFTGVEADRGIAVAVADDDEAFVGLDSGALDRCGRQQFVTVANRFATPVEVSVTLVEATNVRVEEVMPPDDPLQPGERATTDIRLQPDREATTDGDGGTLTVRVETVGDGVRSVLTRTYPVQCVQSGPGRNRTAG